MKIHTIHVRAIKALSYRLDQAVMIGEKIRTIKRKRGMNTEEEEDTCNELFNDIMKRYKLR
jgi:ribosomal protein L17